MKYQQKSFQVPATQPTKVPCAIHHFVKGKCLRCDQKIVRQTEDRCASDRLRVASANLPPEDTHSMSDSEARLMISAPPDSEGPE